MESSFGGYSSDAQLSLDFMTNETLQRELEKARIKLAIISDEISRRRTLEAEVRKELVAEAEESASRSNKPPAAAADHTKAADTIPKQRVKSPPVLVKAETPLDSVSDHKDCIIKTVKEILEEETLEKFDLLKDKLLDESAVTSADILKVVVSMILEKAVQEPATSCSMYAKLCSDLNAKLPSFPTDDEPGVKKTTFKRALLNNCQEAFQGDAQILNSLGILRFIGELFKQRMFPEKILHQIVQELLVPNNDKACHGVELENVEAVCEFLSRIGMQLDDSPNSRADNDVYFSCLKEVASDPQLNPSLRLMVTDLIDLRSNNWLPRAPEVDSNNDITEENPDAENVLQVKSNTTTGETPDAENVLQVKSNTTTGENPDAKNVLQVKSNTTTERHSGAENRDTQTAKKNWSTRVKDYLKSLSWRFQGCYGYYAY